MSTNEFDGKFFIGREYDLKSGKTLEKPTLYDPDDLTTHAVVVGMTGSGKTGLCIDILEEAALNGIPALMIDPKGDIANLLLHFPDLRPDDFQPWVDPDAARREGKSLEQKASDTASLWQNGLAEWGIGRERIDRVRSTVRYTVYTPGSDAGFPVSILASLEAPELPWEENREVLREKISSTVTAILGLVGIESDPLRSREHILLANLFEEAWKQGKDLNLSELILQVQNPPIQKLGAFEVEQFFPKQDRMGLALALNGFLASPSFQTWTEGDALDPQTMLWTPDGQPRHTIFYLAHLPDQERMFFVTLLLSSVETWMRAQAGSSSLRALIYFDEVLGFLPPVKEPPSKAPLMRLLKQARAFGLGLLLTTQNPVDLDYKALSNAGTWFVGRLQTEQDKERLLDGLESAATGRGGFKRTDADKTISSLGKRVFLLHNDHEKAPQVFYSRWAMAYLTGPVTRAQLGDLNALVGADAVGMAKAKSQADSQPLSEGPQVALEGSLTRPAVPTGIAEYFLENNLTSAAALKSAQRDPVSATSGGLIYKPALLAHVSARILDRKVNLDVDRSMTALVMEPDRRGVIRWEDHLSEPIPSELMDEAPIPNARFTEIGPPLTDGKVLGQLEKDYIDFVYRSIELRLLSNPALNLLAEPGVSTGEFQNQCAEAAREACEGEIEKVKDDYLIKMRAAQKKLEKGQRELSEDEAEHSARKMEEVATHFENVIGIFGGSKSRRRISSSMTKRRMTSKAKVDIEESEGMIEDLTKEITFLESEMNEKIQEIEARWGTVANEIEEQVFIPLKKDVLIEFFGVAWVPFWQFEIKGERMELPGFDVK
ncbi:MAG: hypothetical protein A2Z14_16060 [Chloroflexi bacterium RBG_16_48_8]|nr:MAG: hypothetical protein A2Z14_16060 [Chloroflexi bacterium RBG_16_48_8]